MLNNSKGVETGYFRIYNPLVLPKRKNLDTPFHVQVKIEPAFGTIVSADVGCIEIGDAVCWPLDRAGCLRQV